MEHRGGDLEAVGDLADAVGQHGVAGDPQDSVLLALQPNAKPTTSPAIGRLSGGPWRHRVAVTWIVGRPGASSRVVAYGRSAFGS
jgi:hypothetical protein